MADAQFFIVCHVPITGEQYVLDFPDRDAVDAFLASDEGENAGRIIEGREVSIEDFLK